VPLGEADTVAKLVNPAIYHRGWTEDLIKREETAGSIRILEGKPLRVKGRTDLTLRVKVSSQSQPVAVALIEVKAEHFPPDHGLEQVKRYRPLLHVPFAYATNGHLFVEFDGCTSLTSEPRPLSQFPSPTELQARYEQFLGIPLSDPLAKPLLIRYRQGEAIRRYYQDAAIRAVLEKIISCQREGKPKRALLALATGSGKTLIAVQLLRRFADAGQLRRALFVCDRDELRQQALGHLSNEFGAEAQKVFERSDGSNNAQNARIHIATYQTLGIASEDDTAGFLLRHYPENYFSHIIIDECHRSAWGKWSLVLTRNPEAVQVGLTATPRQLTGAPQDQDMIADNYRYFGEPVYEYGIGQGIEDGYLAGCEILRREQFFDLESKSEQERGLDRNDLKGKILQDSNTGETLAWEEAKERYGSNEFEDNIILPERTEAMCQDLFNELLRTGGPEQKTIIFCVRDWHADKVAALMNNLYAQWCREHNQPAVDPYAFKCTAASNGSQYLADLRGSSRHHFIATTVDLLTTGVDVPCVRNIIFFKYVRSAIAFYQMVGRGTRLHPQTDKLMFRVYDYTNATRLFSEDFVTQFAPPAKPLESESFSPRPLEPILEVHGFQVRVSPAGHYILSEKDGQPLAVTVEEYEEQLSARLKEEAPTLDDFRDRWIRPEERHALLAELPNGARSAELVQALNEMEDYDLYDVLADLAYGMSPKRRVQRAEDFAWKHDAWLGMLPAPAHQTLVAIAGQFAHSGTEGLENVHIFQIPEVAKAGGFSTLASLGNPQQVMLEMKERIFSA
jgi:type I restriction enzyme R subunit